MNSGSIGNWVAQAERDAGSGDGGLTTAEREEVNRLRRENRQLRGEGHARESPSATSPPGRTGAAVMLSPVTSCHLLPNPLLPARLRYVGPYQEAQARLSGRAWPNIGTQVLNRLWIGRSELR
jgi:hypothetical protein